MYTKLEDATERRRSHFAARVLRGTAVALALWTALFAGWVGVKMASSPDVVGPGVWASLVGAGGAILATLGLAAGALWVARSIERREAITSPSPGETSEATLRRMLQRERDRVAQFRIWVPVILAAELGLQGLHWLPSGTLPALEGFLGLGWVVLTVLAVTFWVSLRRMRRLEAVVGILDEPTVSG